MSKTIDQSTPLEDLSDEDLIYLHQRNRITDAQLAEAAGENEFDLVDAITAQGGKGTPLDQVANTGDANTRGLTTEQLERELERRRELEARNNPQASSDDEDEEEELDYSSMSNDALRAEIARRNADRSEDDQLSLGGRKDDLIATLEADDEDDEE